MSNNKKTDNDMILAMLMIFIVLIMMQAPLYIRKTSDASVEEEIVEEVNEEEVVEVSDELFETVYAQDTTYRVVLFRPTGVLYVSYNRGDLVPMTDTYGNLLTYAEYKRLTEE